MASVEDNALPVDRDLLCEFPDCKEPAVFTCRKCGRAYCVDHASDLSPRLFCCDDLKLDEAKLVEMPLIDSTGTRVAGRLLRPYGKAWGIFDKYIDEMTDEEEIAAIKEYQSLLHQLEGARSFVQINLSKLLNDAVDRTLLNAKRSVDELGRETLQFQTPKRRAVKTGKAKPSVEDKLLAAMEKLLGQMTPQQLQEFLTKRASAKKKA